MVVETLWPDNAPWWLNLFIWMATFWWYILIGFVPAFYIAVAKLFGFPLLQRWSNEVVIILYPSKAKFGKITQQFEPYFRRGKGVYWTGEPLQPSPYIPTNGEANIETKHPHQEELDRLKAQYEKLSRVPSKADFEKREMEDILRQQKKLQKHSGIKKGKEHKIMTINPINTLHIFTHSVNQPIYDLKRRESKVDEILNNDAKPKKISGHGIWILQNPSLHFHRHWQVIINNACDQYILMPVKEKQQFGIGFWHSIGVLMEKELEVEREVSSGENTSGGGNRQIVQTLITTNVVLQHTKEVQDYQNFSASRAYMLLKRRAKIEEGFMYWVSGAINPIIFIVLGGAIAVIAAIFLLFHGSGPTQPPTTGAHPIL